MMSSRLLAAVAVLCLIAIQNNNGSGGVVVVRAMMEEDRLNEYHKRGYKWPLPEVIPNTPGWRRIMNKRFEQISRIPDSNDKYNGWMGFITAAMVATNYTQNGWGLTRAPEHITKKLQDRLYKTLEVKENECTDEDEECKEMIGFTRTGGARKEHFINVIEGEDHARPYMIHDHKQNRDILNEMKPMFKWWSGLELEGTTAYGIRAYRNDSNLLMHVDKSSTHVISGIYHVDRSDDAEPWPIVIEDFQGNTNQVYLEPGDLLFYESSKCFHGRPQVFIGGYYASLFMHYRPVDYNHEDILNEIHYAIPEHWRETPPPPQKGEGLDEMQVVGTSFKEPNCKNLLCSLDETNDDSKYTVNWSGPAPKGKIVTTGWDPKTMTPPAEWAESGYDGGKGSPTEGGKGEL